MGGMKTRQPVWNDLHYTWQERQTDGSLFEKTLNFQKKKYRRAKGWSLSVYNGKIIKFINQSM